MKKTIEKKEAYFFHARNRSLQRYNLAMDKKRVLAIVDAIKVPNEYIPISLITDWPRRAKYEVEYMGIPMHFIYDKEQDTIVTFLPLSNNEKLGEERKI